MRCAPALCPFCQLGSPGQRRPRPGRERGGRPRGQNPAAQPSQDTADILEAIKGSQEALEKKKNTMAIDINYLHLDRRKVVERVKNTEEEVLTVQVAVGELQA
ncbi:hypothetical protein NDU88_006137 [Pleurodeles waltl]|uniref:Uncharacterized protein n=1 Tax=Pleurodeles waltl TaxID=8319 RepID=A0AAV7TDK0_PLEWA|nr:hypothetical protein NDU88_006137 [Pleurodeles waltl]